MYTELQRAVKIGTEADLSCNACMVCAGQPQCGSVTHPCIARHDVLQGHKHGMAHVQPACDIWGRHGHRKWFPSACVLRLKHTTLLPPTNKLRLLSCSFLAAQ